MCVFTDKIKSLENPGGESWEVKQTNPGVVEGEEWLGPKVRGGTVQSEMADNLPENWYEKV